MKNYILIISILTIIIVFIAIYLSDYIKNIYFNNSILDFKEAFSIISKYHENYENRSEVTSKYEELLNSRKVNFFDTTNTNYASAQELSLNTETEKFKKRMYDMYETINDPISDEFLPYTTKNYKEDPVAISNNNINEYTRIFVAILSFLSITFVLPSTTSFFTTLVVATESICLISDSFLLFIYKLLALIFLIFKTTFL